MKRHDFSYAVVVGFGEFPFDMLRYDSCCPNAQEDVNKIDARERGEMRAVVVRRWECQPSDWTPDRWRSFLWGFSGPFRNEFEARDRGQEMLAAVPRRQH